MDTEKVEEIAFDVLEGQNVEAIAKIWKVPRGVVEKIQEGRHMALTEPTRQKLAGFRKQNWIESMELSELFSALKDGKITIELKLDHNHTVMLQHELTNMGQKPLAEPSQQSTELVVLPKKNQAKLLAIPEIAKRIKNVLPDIEDSVFTKDDIVNCLRTKFPEAIPSLDKRAVWTDVRRSLVNMEYLVPFGEPRAGKYKLGAAATV